MIAHCHLRNDVRLFAVERIRSITLTDHPYQMPLGFDVEEYVKDALMIMCGRRIEVELLFSKQVAAWVKDKLWHSSQETLLLKDGRFKNEPQSSRHGRACRLDLKVRQPGEGRETGKFADKSARRGAADPRFEGLKETL